MSCSPDGICLRQSHQTDNISREKYFLFGVAILVIVTFIVINCTVKASTAIVFTLCTAVSLFMVWLCMTAVANSGGSLRPIGSTAGLPAMANTVDMRVLVGATHAPTQIVTPQPHATPQNCMAGAYNPDFIDINQVTWDYNKIPVNGAVPGAGDPNGEESARWIAASEAWRHKIAQSIRPDDDIVFDEDECLSEQQRISKPMEAYDFSTTAHGGYGQRMIQEGIGTQNVPASLDHNFGPNHNAPIGTISFDH